MQVVNLRQSTASFTVAKIHRSPSNNFHRFHKMTAEKCKDTARTKFRT